MPAELSSFVGRRQELTDARRLLSEARLVTLTGVGGVGKTRLAMRVAIEARRAFPDGTWLVELGGIHPQMPLPLAVSNALRIADQSAGDPLRALVGYLAERQLLLVLDNCEHLVPSVAALVTELLRAAPGLRVLATSREVLGIPGEQVFVVSPLAVPDPNEVVAAEAALRFPGLALFAERAAAAAPGFAITDSNVELVARVCRRLDGIPLAIELAAARVRALSVQQLASRLDDRFRLLTSGNRAAMPRHHTLRAAVEWSFDLCAKPERLLWQRVSVFAGGFDLEAAERVVGGDGLPPAELLGALSGLVDKSVLVAEPDPTGYRYRMLDTVREYGLDRLRAGPDGAEESRLRRRHRDWCLELAGRFHADWFGPRQSAWTERMGAELPNLRAALAFCVDTPGEIGTGLRLAGDLYYFWYGCGETQEGKHWLERVLAASVDLGPDRAWALAVYARMSLVLGEARAAVDAARECLALEGAADDAYQAAHVLQSLGLGLTFLGEPNSYVAEADARARELGDTHPAVAFTTLGLGIVKLVSGDPVGAGELFAAAEEICRAHGERWWRGIALATSVVSGLRLGDLARATSHGRQALAVREGLRDTVGATWAVEFMAWVAATAGDHVRAARLLGAMDRHWGEIGWSPIRGGQWRPDHDECVATTRCALGPARFDEEFARGRQLALPEAIAYVLGKSTGSGRPAPASVQPQLTKRESQIAALIAEGLSNREIAARLVISQRTAEGHVENILAKLGFTSRARIVAWHAEQRGDAAH